VVVLLPEQVIALLQRLPYPVKIAVLLVASTGVRISECLGLMWKHVEWANNRIFIHQTFKRARCRIGRRPRPATHPSRCVRLWQRSSDWRQQTPYDKDEDFIFASPKLKGKQPLWDQTMNADFVKPAVVALGLVAKGESFGWHRFSPQLEHVGERDHQGHHGLPNPTSSQQARDDRRLHPRKFSQGSGCPAAIHGAVVGSQTGVGGRSVTSIGLASGWGF
jgi:hypothetical protein